MYDLSSKVISDIQNRISDVQNGVSGAVPFTVSAATKKTIFITTFFR